MSKDRLIKDGVVVRVFNAVKYNAFMFSLLLLVLVITQISLFFFIDQKVDSAIDKMVETSMWALNSRDDGTFVMLKKSPLMIDDERYKRELVKIGKRLILDGSFITKGFTTRPSKALDIYNIESFKAISDAYLANTKQKYRLSSLYFKRYQDDELPETIRILESKVVEYDQSPDISFVPPEDLDGLMAAFAISMEFRAYVRYVLVEEGDRVYERIKHFKVVLSGYYNPIKYRSLDNPNGLRIFINRNYLPMKRGGKK